MAKVSSALSADGGHCMVFMDGLVERNGKFLWMHARRTEMPDGRERILLEVLKRFGGTGLFMRVNQCGDVLGWRTWSHRHEWCAGWPHGDTAGAKEVVRGWFDWADGRTDRVPDGSGSPYPVSSRWAQKGLA